MAKKKKKGKYSGVSFSDYTRDVLGDDVYIEEPTEKVTVYNDDDDIAPVKTTAPLVQNKSDSLPFNYAVDQNMKRYDDRTWFEKSGHFDDGYQFGDVSKAILSSGADLVNNIVVGIAGMPEKILDGMLMLGNAMSAQQQMENMNYQLQYDALFNKGKNTQAIIDNTLAFNQEVEEGTMEMVAQDLYNEQALLDTKYGQWAEKGSVLGEKTDELAQSGGQLAATAALQAAGVPWYLTTGAVTFGSEAENALNQGATYDEAMLSATISAGAEILTEKISGGISFGGKALDDVLTDALAKNVSSKVTRTLLKLGIDAVGEGNEEILSGVMSAVGQKLTYADDKELEELFTSEDAWDAFIGGAALGGGSSVVNTVKGKVQGVDAVTGMTKNEQAVFDKVYNDAIAEAESDGKKLTQSEKNKIYDAVRDDMEKGNISTDTIEEVLGGEAYQGYKDTIDSEDAAIKELSELYEGEELQQAIDDILNNSERGNMQTKLSEETVKTLQGERGGKGSLLLESYNQNAQRSQAFKADLTQYDTKQQGIIQKAIDSGILNNTRKTHEFVDMLAKISADKGVSFDFTNNEKLKGSSFAVNGKAVNGYVTSGGIVLNMNSSKALNSVVGHEVTHVLEGTEMYDALQDVIFEYANGKKASDSKFESEYKERLYNTRQLYKDVEGYQGVEGFKKIKREVVSDLVGDYIFNDTEFVKNLSTKHRNVFEKMYDEIKYLCKVVTAGSQEARDLERAKRAFEEAYRADSTAKGDIKYSLAMVDEVQPKSDKWHRTHTTEEAIEAFPDMWNVAAEESEVRNPTQITSTVKSYRKIYNHLQSEGFNGTILDASSGLGYGTKAGIEEFGFDVEDIEPYPDKGYNPKYTDYSALDKKYDVVISNAVLNVLPQDQRDALVVKMGELLNDGGRMFINVRGKDVETLANTGKNIHLGDMEWIETVKGSYQKGFTKDELKAYLEDALGDGFTVEKTNMFGAVSVVVTKNFESNQIKSVANEKPTGDADIRFSLSESVEESGELMAIHNLSEGKLLKALKLGGLPMPSVAIAKAQNGHDDFGEISLVLPKETIDPKASRNNKLYSGDAWTPTYPRVEYKLNKNVLEQIRDKLESVVSSEILTDFGRAHLDSDNMTDTLDRFNGNVVDAFKNNYGLKYAYLADTGIDISLPMTEKKISYYSNRENEAIIRVAQEIPVEMLEAVNQGTEEYDTIEPTIRRVLTEYLQEKYKDTPEIIDLLIPKEKMPFNTLNGYVVDALSYHRNGIQQTVDKKAARELIDEKADQADYEAWLGELFSDIVEKEGIRNNVDFFTPSGNRRSFEALHYEHNLENVVKAMREKGTKGIGGIGGGNIFGASTTEFSSIEEMKQNSDRLRKMSQDEYDEIRKEYTDRFFDLAYRLPIHKDSYSATSAAGNMLVEAVAKYKTRSGIANYLRKESQGWANYSEDIVDDLIDLVNDIRQMPTGYFEAKPQRAVGFDEVGVFVIPRNADVKLKQELLSRGYAIAEYDPDVEGDRQKVVNSFEEYKFSLSAEGETPRKRDPRLTYGEDVLLEQDVAPVQDAAPLADAVTEHTAKSGVPMAENTDAYAMVGELQTELDQLESELPVLAERGEEALHADDAELVNQIIEQYTEKATRAQELRERLSALENERASSLGDADAPAEMDAPYTDAAMTPDDPFYDRDIKAVGSRKVKAYMYENPEVKPFFQEEANNLLGELYATEKPETIYNGDLKYNMAYEFAKDIPDIIRTSRVATDDIVYLRDAVGMSYADIEKGLKAIIEDNGAENIAAAKKIEFVLNDRLLKGYKDALGYDIPENQDYINLLKAKQITEYNDDARKQLFETDDYVPATDDIAPAAQDTQDVAPVADKAYEAIKPKRTKEPRLIRVKDGDIAPSATYETTKKSEIKGQRSMFAEGKTAEVMDAEPETPKKKNRFWSKLMESVPDKGFVFENLSKKTKNRELEAKWNFIRYAEGRAQTFMKKGAAGVKSLDGIRSEVEGSGLTKQFYEYMYHALNVDRMTLEDRYDGMQNKAVFGDSVTAEVSREAVAKMEAEHPEVKQWAQDVYGYMNSLRGQLVANGVISQETADLWAEMYPHYVPIRRVGDSGLNINVPLDTGKTGVNAPIKRATGGNSDILPLFDTIGQRTLQTYRAIAKNSFGVELKNTLNTTVENEAASVDDVIDSIDTQDGLLQEGKNGKSPTFTVFENGKRVTFEITEEMYEALRPTSDMLKYRNKVLSKASSIFRGLVTEYNPVFMATNIIKDTQDILMNSQHAAKTYWSIPKAIKEMATKGKWYTEYMENGGEQNTYFDNETNTFLEDRKGVMKLVGMPLDVVSFANNTIERVPRLAEYIASREAGRSIEVSMLDAARVTTNFAAGGDFVKFLNGNGCTFLNASVQGAMQQVRNVREAKMNGLKGWASLAARVAVAGLPAMFLNGLLWDDDEDYEELSDYVKDNYYIVAKYGDGQFVRIPKGRALAVIQDAMEQVKNAATGDDEVDLGNFLELVVSNLAPNNPLDNNIFAPIAQALRNETWYGEDLVPSRLQDLPAAEQYDESTDSISRWLGEKLGDIGIDVSPYKINYLLNQYSGGLGDVFLPMLTPEAERGDNSLLAPFRDKFTTDSVLNNQNVSDFYDIMDELTTNAKASTATDEDVLKYKYLNSVNADLADLYERKREIQNSGLSDAAKYSQIRAIQEQINSIAENSLNTYGNVYINGEYARVGDRHYRLNNDGEWQKVTDKQLEKQNEVTSGLGISASDYWGNKEEYDFAYDSPEKYAVAKSVGGYEAYKFYSSELYDIKADKDESGKSISGSRKEKVIDYINGLDADYGEKIILFKSEYNADDTYNYDIIDYLNSREDISYEEMETILKELGFTVDSRGNIYWD